MWGTFNINEAIYTYGKWKLSHQTCSHLIAYCLIHKVLIFNPCPIRRCGLHIMVSMYMDVQLDDERIRVKENPLVYIIRRIFKRSTPWIYVTYAIKVVIIKKLMKLDNICYVFCICFKLFKLWLLFLIQLYWCLIILKSLIIYYIEPQEIHVSD